MIACVLLLQRVAYQITLLHSAEQAAHAVRSAETAFATNLDAINDAYVALLGRRIGEHDIFQKYFDDRATELRNAIYRAVDRDELQLSRDHVVSVDSLLELFSGRPTDVFRAVHYLADNDFFFDVYARQYFFRFMELVKKGRVKEVRRLLVYDNQTELDDPRSQRLMQFHAATPGFGYRAIRLVDYRSMLRDHRLEGVSRDFGVYGSAYVYCAETNQIDAPVGHWVRNQARVEQFIRCFDACWQQPLTTRPVGKGAKMSFDGLFGLGVKADEPGGNARIAIR